MSKLELTNRDSDQTVRYEHDEKNDAKRVVVVGGDFGIADAVKNSLKDLTLNFEQPRQQTLEWPMTIEKEVIVKQTQVVEVPKIIKETEVKIVEVPRIVFETKIIEIEKPVIIKETEIKVIEHQTIVKEIKNLDKWFFVFLTLNLLTLLFLGLHK